MFTASSTFAQGSIAGAVQDTTGAVMPGVTVEASSPALIEKVRTVSTDSAGLYQIVDLRPGVYTVTFSLDGFNTVKREGIEVTGSFTAALDEGVQFTVMVGGRSFTMELYADVVGTPVHNTSAPVAKAKLEQRVNNIEWDGGPGGSKARSGYLEIGPVARFGSSSLSETISFGIGRSPGGGSAFAMGKAGGEYELPALPA